MKIRIRKLVDTKYSKKIISNNEESYYINKKIFNKLPGAMLLRSGDIIEIGELDPTVDYKRITSLKLLNGNAEHQPVEIDAFVAQGLLINNFKASIKNPLSESVILRDVKSNYKIQYSNFKIIDYPEISVIQNFISAINKKISKTLAITLLEIAKTNTQSIDVYLPKNINQKIKTDTLKFIDEVIKNYNSIFKIKVKIDFNKFNIQHTDSTNLYIEAKGNAIFIAEHTQDAGVGVNFIEQSTPIYSKLDAVKAKKSLNWIAKHIFWGAGIKSLKNKQIEALVGIINGKNTLAVLRTGYGKSLIYQMFTFLSPMIAVAVFPINGLIEDQERNLLKNRFEFILSNKKIKKTNSNRILEKDLVSKRLFFVTPERIENKIFHEEIKSLSKYIGSIIFDEAHCISEWGHDFRPAYLVAKNMLMNISKISKDFRTIALTATAAPHIQRDIQQILNIDASNVVSINDGWNGFI